MAKSLKQNLTKVKETLFSSIYEKSDLDLIQMKKINVIADSFIGGLCKDES